MTLQIRAVLPEDAQNLLDIYVPYVNDTWVTFETEVPSVREFGGRIEQFHFKQGFPFFVAELSGELVGYAYAHPFHERDAYRFTAETSVYVKQDLGRGGIGTALYNAVLGELKKKGFHSVMAILGYPNEASKSFHEKFGFLEVGRFIETGYKFDQWLDVGYFQKIL